jgi:hypothetical protein
MTQERDIELLRTPATDEGDIPGRPSPAGTLIVIIALLIGLLYFGVTRTATPSTVQSHAPTLATPQPGYRTE